MKDAFLYQFEEKNIRCRIFFSVKIINNKLQSFKIARLFIVMR